MYTEIIRPTDQVTIRKGDRFYLHTEHGTFLRKITWLGEHAFEWNCGWCDTMSLELNLNSKSKVKFELNENKVFKNLEVK
jgi:hypothetical protein